MNAPFEPGQRVRLRRNVQGYPAGAWGLVTRTNVHPATGQVISYFVRLCRAKIEVTLYPKELQRMKHE